MSTTISIEVPSHYGYVILTTVVGQFVTSFLMGGNVMEARKKYNVPIPNMYATPEYHKEADAFNRVQRGHQNLFESLGTYSLFALVGGLKYVDAWSIDLCILRVVLVFCSCVFSVAKGNQDDFPRRVCFF